MDVIIHHTTQRGLPHTTYTTQRKLQVMYDTMIWTMRHVSGSCSTDKLYNKDGSSDLTASGEGEITQDRKQETVEWRIHIVGQLTIGQFHT